MAAEHFEKTAHVRAFEMVRQAYGHRNSGSRLLALIGSVEDRNGKREVADADLIYRYAAPIFGLLNVRKLPFGGVFHGKESVGIRFGILGPRGAGLPNAHFDDANRRAQRVFGAGARSIGGQIALQFVVNPLRHHLGSGILLFETDDAVAERVFQIAMELVLRVDAEGMVPRPEELAHGFLERLEVADHFVSIELVGLQNEFHLAAMTVREFAEVRMLGQHVTAFDLEGFTDTIRHELVAVAGG